MKKKIVVLFVMLYSLQCICQEPGKIWYFGDNAGLDFNNGAPVAITDGAMESNWGAAAMCNAFGGIMFYTNGKTVWNKDHEIMENGTGLLSDVLTLQPVVIVPKPGSNTIYYIFTTDSFHEGPVEGLNYSEVDMSLDGGKGAITSNKNMPLLSQVTEQLTTAKHANGIDMWVISHSYSGDAFHAFLVTENGVSVGAVTSNAGPNYQDGSSHYSLKVSPSGNKIVSCHRTYRAHLYDFDPATGIISNPVQVIQGYIPLTAEFSESGNVLYLTSQQIAAFFQLDLLAADIPGSVQIQPVSGQVRSCERGPDGKIYFASVGDYSSIGVINNPDVLGTGCNIDSDAISLGGKLHNGGVCVSVQLPAIAVEIEAINFCLSETTQFSIIGITPDGITWDFGDGATSSGLTAGHAYAASGTYTVTATVVTGSQSVTVTKEITIYPLPTAFVPDALVLCDDISNDGIETFDLSQRNAQIFGGQSPTDFTISYHLTESDAKAGINPIGNSYTNTANPGLVHARVTNNVTGCHAETQLTLFVWPYLEVEMDDTFSFCEGGSVTLTAPDGYIAYAWSTGESTQSITVDAAGQYTVTVSSDKGEVICQASKTVTVTGTPSPVFELDEEYTFCKKGGVWVKVAEGFDSYQWSTGETTNAVFISQTGNYTVAVTKEGCETIKTFNAKEILCGIIIPKGISPNDDGKNDNLNLAGSEATSLSIYNRYGLQVYHKDNYTDEWYGQSDDGDELPTGTYFYSVRAKDRLDQSGWIYVNREL